MTTIHAGQLQCECALVDHTEPVSAPDPAKTAALAIGFGLSTLSQALVLAALPIAATIIAPGTAYAGLPYAAWLGGALLATFPASILHGLFGSRAAFALGASIGAAGGLLAYKGFAIAHFPIFVIGAFWLGIAQGVGLYYRHVAAQSGQARSLPLLFAAGVLAIIFAPALTALLRSLGQEWLPGNVFLAAGVLNFLTLGSTLIFPSRQGRDSETVFAPVSLRIFLFVSLSSAWAWFVMTRVMAGTPLLVEACGFGMTTASGLIAWHMLAMYLPASALGFVAPRLPAWPMMAFGSILLAISYVFLQMEPDLSTIGTALTVAGLGWSLTMFYSLRKLCENGPPSRLVTAAHDATIFAGAIIGALSI